MAFGLTFQLHLSTELQRLVKLLSFGMRSLPNCMHGFRRQAFLLYLQGGLLPYEAAWPTTALTLRCM